MCVEAMSDRLKDKFIKNGVGEHNREIERKKIEMVRGRIEGSNNDDQEGREIRVEGNRLQRSRPK